MRKICLLLSAIFLLLLNTMAQNRTITGKVTDDKGQPVDKASVVVKGTKLGTSTNNLGIYTLSIPATAKTLVISSVGMVTQEISISAGNFDIAMVTDMTSMAAVVVTVPYGTVKKTAFTGAENTISASQIQKQQVTSVTRALDGLVPGIIVTNGGGQPGTGAQVLIRGVGSVNATSAPLYVLNGVPYDGSIAAISNDDIETVTVLKDAAAAALYGSRAANGVIMITTKKGKRGKANVTGSLRQGLMARGIPEYNRVGPKEYYELFWESYRNFYVSQGDNMSVAGQKASDILTSTNGLVYNAYNVPGNELVNPETGKLNPNAKLLWNESWEDALFRTASRTNANMSISGANDNMDYFFSAGYLNEDGIVRNSGYKRYNFRVNLNMNATDWLTTGVNLDGAVARRADLLATGSFTSNPFYYSRQMGPIYPVYQHDLVTGAFIDTLGEHKLDWGVPEQMGARPYAGRSNLRGSLDLDDQHSDIFNGNANVYAEIKFLKDFTFRTTLGLNLYNSYDTYYQNNQFGDAAPSSPGAGDGGRSTKTENKQLSLTGNEVLTWRHTFNDKHNFRVLGGHENYKYKYNYLTANSAGFLFPGQTEIDNGSGPFSPASSREDNHRIESYFANLNYDYNQKYLVSASYRTDGSSRFKKDVRWGNFYSAGLGWRISQEKFMKKVSWLNELKLRASYGEQGNDNIGLFYPYRPYYYANGLGSYTAPVRPNNEDLLWEKNKVTNIGFDFAGFKNKFNLTFEWFNRVSDNLLFDVPLPPSTGYSSVYQNTGSMKNYGYELQLGYNAIQTKKLKWRIDLNYTHFKNKITRLPAIQEKTGIVSGTKKLSIGHGIFDFWLPEYAGVDAANGDALYYKDLLDANGNVTGRTITNVYNQATYYYHGSALPKFSGGLTNSINYKGFDLSILLTFSYGGLYYDGNLAGLMHRGEAGFAWSSDILQRWQKPGDVTNVPRLQNGIAGQDGASTRWLMDGSWLNIKNITLSYNVPQVFSKSISGLSVFVNVDNAHLFTAKKGMDPQRDFDGTSDASYSPYRTITAGFTVNLK